MFGLLLLLLVQEPSPHGGALDAGQDELPAHRTADSKPAPLPVVTPVDAVAGAASASAAPLASADTRPRLILLDLHNSGLDAAVVRILSDTLSTSLTKGPFAVTSAADMRVLMNLEADKQMLNCQEDTSQCEAEIASALGADVLVHGSAGALGDDVIVNLSLYDSARNTAITREKVQSKDVRRLNQKVEIAAARMIAMYEGKVPPPAPPDEDEEKPQGAGLALPLLLGGAFVGAVGATVAVVGSAGAIASSATLEQVDSSGPAKAKARDDYPVQTGILIAGAALTLAGVALAASSMVFE